MFRSFRSLPRLLITLSFLLPALQPASSTAAEVSTERAESATAEDIENIVVTASRIPLPLDQTGSAVSVIDRQLLENRQSVFTVDVLQDLPGVAVSRTAGIGSVTDVRIRGAEANQVLVVIDGVEANDPALGDTFDFTSLLSYDIETLEVLRGPQSALWGSDATAGVINVTTRNGTEGFNGDVFVEGGSFDTVFGGTSTAWNTARGGVDFNASYFDTDGENASLEGSEDDGYDSLNMNLQTRYQPSDNSRISLFSRYTSGTSEYDGTDFQTGLPTDSDLRSDDDLLLAGISGGFTLLDGLWDQSLRLTYLDSDHQQKENGSSTARSRADKTGFYYQSTFNLPGWAGFTGQHLILALDYEDENFRQRGTAFGVFDPNQDQGMDNTGYVAEFLTSPLRGLNLSASVRYDDNSEFDDIVSYRFTGSYLFTATGTRLHSSYGKGQKSPTFIERFGFYPDQFIGNPDLEPEQNRGFDVGIQQLLGNDRASIDITWFSERLQDEINGFVFDPATGTFTAVNLSGTSRRDGLEVELQGTLTDTLSVAMSYTYTDTRQPDGSGGLSRELRRPKQMASANLNQRLFNGAGNINVNVSYVSDQRDQFFPPFPAAPQLIKLDSYILVNVAGSYRLSPRLEVYARANNAFDESYQNVVGYQTPGRALFVGARMNL